MIGTEDLVPSLFYKNQIYKIRTEHKKKRRKKKGFQRGHPDPKRDDEMADMGNAEVTADRGEADGIVGNVGLKCLD